MSPDRIARAMPYRPARGLLRGGGVTIATCGERERITLPAMSVTVSTAREALGSATAALEAAGCESARLDAELLLADALGVDAVAVRHRAGDGDRRHRRHGASARRVQAAGEPRAGGVHPRPQGLSPRGAPRRPARADPAARDGAAGRGGAGAARGRLGARRGHRLRGDRARAGGRAPGPARERVRRLGAAVEVARANGVEAEHAGRLAGGDSTTSWWRTCRTWRTASWARWRPRSGCSSRARR